MAKNSLFLIGRDILRAEKLARLYGIHTVQIKEIQSSVIGSLVVITAHPRHLQFFTLVTSLYEALICEYGFRISRDLQTETFRMFIQSAR